MEEKKIRERKDRIVSVRFSPEELEYLEGSRDGNGNLSQYLRELLLSGTGSEWREQRLRQLRNATETVYRIGVRINGTARKINTGYLGSQEDIIELKEELARIEDALRGLRAAVEESIRSEAACAGAGRREEG